MLSFLLLYSSYSLFSFSLSRTLLASLLCVVSLHLFFSLLPILLLPFLLSVIYFAILSCCRFFIYSFWCTFYLLLYDLLCSLSCPLFPFLPITFLLAFSCIVFSTILILLFHYRFLALFSCLFLCQAFPAIFFLFVVHTYLSFLLHFS